MTDKNTIPNIRYDALGNPFVAYSTPVHNAPTPPDYTADGLIDIVVEDTFASLEGLTPETEPIWIRSDYRPEIMY